MSDQSQTQNPTGQDDVEGHFRRSEPDRMEGWGADRPQDDVEGHFRREASESQDDVEGHFRRGIRESQELEDTAEQTTAAASIALDEVPSFDLGESS